MFKLATDESPGVRREVCIGFCQLISTHPELLEHQLPQLIEYMLVSNQVRAGVESVFVLRVTRLFSFESCRRSSSLILQLL